MRPAGTMGGRTARCDRLPALCAAGARSWAAVLLLLGASGCALPPASNIAVNRPNGEGYAGRGELVLRVGLQQPEGGGNLLSGWAGHPTGRGSVEIRYLGLDPSGRAIFQRHDIDDLAGAPARVLPQEAMGDASAGQGAPAQPLNTREIVLDLRLTRQIHVQGKIIEVLEATASGVVFRLY
jgi:hypothetical protein